MYLLLKMLNLNFLNDFDDMQNLIDVLIISYFFRVCQRRFDANIYVCIIDVNDDNVFLFKCAKWLRFECFECFVDLLFHRTQILILFCCSIDWKTKSKNRAKIIDENNKIKRINRCKIWLIDKFKIINHRKAQSFMYNISFFLNRFFANITNKSFIIM